MSYLVVEIGKVKWPEPIKIGLELKRQPLV
jgi:hypothetical protein